MAFNRSGKCKRIIAATELGMYAPADDGSVGNCNKVGAVTAVDYQVAYVVVDGEVIVPITK